MARRVPTLLLILPPGVLLDRFGSDNGRFLSPKGAAFAADFHVRAILAAA